MCQSVRKVLFLWSILTAEYYFSAFLQNIYELLLLHFIPTFKVCVCVRVRVQNVHVSV